MSHRDLLALPSTPSGQTNTHGRPIGRFPASLPLRHISNLCDALIGQSKWTEPLVRKEVNVLFGKDEEAAWNFVHACRRNLLHQYKFNMKIIRELEIKHYGKNSYYYLVENGLYHEPEKEGDYPSILPDDIDDIDETSGRDEDRDSRSKSDIEGNKKKGKNKEEKEKETEEESKEETEKESQEESEEESEESEKSEEESEESEESEKSEKSEESEESEEEREEESKKESRKARR